MLNIDEGPIWLGEPNLRIDLFCHIFPAKFLRQYVKTQLAVTFKFLEAETPAEEAFMVDDEARIKHMDKHKIDIEVLTLAFQSAVGTVPDKDLMRITRVANDSLAETVQKHKDRMIGVAMLPKLTDDALDELDRCINDLGMRGCEIFTNILGKPLDSPEFMPFYERMAKYDLPILIHPTNWMYYPWVKDYRIQQIFGWPFDTTLAMSRIVFGGVLMRLPKLKIVTHHLGGMLPFYAERARDFFNEAIMDPTVYGTGHFPYAEEMKRQGKHPIDYFKQFYADTVVYGSAPALRCGLDFFGADHVVYATDYPFGTNKGEVLTQLVTDSILKLDIPDEDKEKIFEKNARRLLRLS